MSAHAEAIEILMNGSPNFRDIGIALAKNCPELFVELHSKIQYVAPAWMTTVINFLKGNNIVSAVKETRNATGFGLKESKDICDNVAYCLQLREYAPNQITNDDMFAVFKQLLEVGRKSSKGVAH